MTRACGGGGEPGGGWGATGDERVERAKARGNDAFARGEYEAAARSYTLALNLDPNSHVLLSNRSAAACALGDFAGALEDARAAVELMPGWAKGHSRLGGALAGLGRYSEAIDA